MFWNSALSSVKIVARNVSIAGPAGTQLAEHGEPGVEQGATVARATLTDGSWKLAERVPEKEVRENTTANIIASLRAENEFNNCAMPSTRVKKLVRFQIEPATLSMTHSFSGPRIPMTQRL